MNAAKSVFPDASVTGCFFHYCKALKTNIEKRGLKTEYYRGSQLHRHVKSLAALAHLPIDSVEEGFLEVMSNSPDNRPSIA